MASSYHQLGIVAQERRNFKEAEKWYLKSLEVKERLGDEYHAAPTYHQLGIAAQDQRDFETAEEWYLKALDIFERLEERTYAEVVQRGLDNLRTKRDEEQ